MFDHTVADWVRPRVLVGEKVRLEPLSQAHAQGLYNRGQTASDWTYLPRPCFIDLADTRQWIDDASGDENRVAFAVVETGKNKTIGSSSYLNIRPQHRGLEIGWTWLGSEWQRTGVNTEAKLLLLTYAFETLGCERVEFKTDARNKRSQAALARIGAVVEGTLRSHMLVQGNHVRDSVFYSVIRQEWPGVRARLEQLLQR